MINITGTMLTKAAELAYKHYEKATKEAAEEEAKEKEEREKKEQEKHDYHKVYGQKLEKLNTLHSLGVLSDEEFNSEKEEVLASLKKVYYNEKNKDKDDVEKFMSAISAVTNFGKKTAQFAQEKGQQIFSEPNRSYVAQTASNVLGKSADVIKSASNALERTAGSETTKIEPPFSNENLSGSGINSQEINTVNTKEKLEQLASLYQAGILTEEEFKTKKTELLARM